MKTLRIITLILVASIHTLLVIPMGVSAQEEARIKFDHPFKLDMPVDLAFIQDRDGFLWIGTQNGLVRYDGYEKVIYRTGPNSVSNDMITSIVEDKDGALWIGTQGGGVDKYDKETNKFTHYRYNAKDTNSLGSDTLSLAPQALFIDHSYTLWVGTQDSGLDRLDVETGVFTHYRHDPNNPGSLSDNTVWAITQDPAGNIWVGTAGGLEKLDPKTGAFTHFRYNPHNPNSVGKGWIYRILVDKQDPNILWIGTVGGGLNRFDTNTQTFTRYSRDPKVSGSLSNDEVVSLYEDDLNRLWIGWFRVPAEGGISIFDKKTGTFSDILPNPNDPFGLSTNQVRAFCQDRSGTMWLANFDGKIDKYEKDGQKFKLYQNNPNNPGSLSDNSALSYYEDSHGVMWFGTLAGGLNRYNKETDTFTSYKYDPKDPHSVRNNFVSRIFEDRSGTFWVATRGGALSIFDRTTGKCVKTYQHDPNNPDSVPEFDSIRYIIEDKDNPEILWMGTYLGGFLKFDKRSEKFKAYKAIAGDPNSLNTNDVIHLCQDDEGLIWLSSLGGGLYKFDRTTEKFTRFANDPANPNSLGSNQVWESHEYEPGYLWVATIGGGLEKFDKKKQTFERFTKENGFPANGIMTIRRDQSGNLWMGTDDGLVMFNPETKKTRSYKKIDGLQGDVFLDAAAWFTKDGQMWFGGVGGVNSFYPDKLKDNTFIPPVVLTSLKQGGFDMKLDTGLTRLKEITLDSHNNFFEFSYAALSYTLPEKNQYAYMLEGFDKDWYNAGTQRFGRYSGLPAGTYTLRIKASNNDGVWNEQGISIIVTVVPPFWATTWFKFIMLLLLICIVLGGFGLRIRSMSLQKRKLKLLVEERTWELKEAKEAAEEAMQVAEESKEAAEESMQVAEESREAAEAANKAKSVFLANMSHELRTPLNAILGYTQIFKRKKLDPSLTSGLNIMMKSGEHLLTLINDILDLSKVEAGKVDFAIAQVYLPNFLDTITGIIQSRAVSKDIEFSFKTSGNLPPIVLADETRLRQVLLNLLGNAVKFTDKGRVTWDITVINTFEPDDAPDAKQMKTFRFEVKDTGVGIAPEHIEDVFKPFVQTGEEVRRREGTGLGLTISRQLVSLMGGELHLESQPGIGSRFWFDLTLPVMEATVLDETQSAGPAIIGHTGPKYKVLVVDDVPTNRTVVADMLEPLGFEIFEAENGKRAVAKAQEIHPDFILMDRWMPEWDGIEAARQIRQIPGFEKVPIITMSASISEEDRAQSETVGHTDFLPKPIYWPRLAELLKEHLMLEWEYGEDKDGVKVNKVSEAALIPPPQEEIRILYGLAKAGDIFGIRERVKVIEMMGETYAPFAAKLGKLAEGFEERQILALITKYKEAE